MWGVEFEDLHSISLCLGNQQKVLQQIIGARKVGRCHTEPHVQLGDSMIVKWRK